MSNPIAVAAAVSASIDLLSAAVRLTQTSQRISQIILAAQTENRDLTEAEWAEVQAGRAAARAVLDAAIVEAKAKAQAGA